MPFTGEVVVMAQLLWMGSIQEDASSPNWSVFMRFNDTIVGPTRRRIQENVDTANGAHDGLSKLRHVTPHWVANDVTPGWYDTNMYIVPIQNVDDANQARVWCRNMIVVKMKRP